LRSVSTPPHHCYRHPDRETGLSCSECGRPICYECMTPAVVGLRCPDHSGKPQGVRKITAAATRTTTGLGSRRVNAVTMALIAINVLVYLAELGAGGTVNGLDNTIYEHGALYGPLVAQGDWWRLITSAFLHYGPFHLAINMYSLYFAGSILEQVIGRWRFALLYLASGLAGAAGALVWSPNVPTVGASGAIFGVLGALFVLERRGHIATGGQVAGLIVLNLIFTFVLSSVISVGGHVGGLIGGFLLMLAFVRFRRSWQLSLAAAAVGAAAAIVVAYSAI
jgi:membrane associated rhomboid family serine protease